MALTRLDLIGDGTTTVYNASFSLGYLQKAYVYVYLSENDFTNQLGYSWLNDSQIVLNTPVTIGTAFSIRRVVPRNVPANDYEAGAILREDNLDDSFVQSLMILEEVEDGYIVATGEFKLNTTLNMQGNKVVNVGEATSSGDAVNLGTMDAAFEDFALSIVQPVPLGDGIWEVGKTYTGYNQYLNYNGEAFSPLQGTVLPYTVGAVPDLGFVYQIKLNSLQALSGLTNPSDLAQRHRIKTTVAEIATGAFNVDDLLEVIDRVGAAFNVKVGVANGYNQVNAGGGNVAVLQRNENNSYTPTAFGFPDDSVTDSYSAWLAYASSGITYFDWDNGTYVLSDFAQINTGTTHNFAGTKLKALGANKVLRAGFADDWAVTGSLTLSGTGDGSDEVAEDATILFELEDNKRWLVENVTCLDSLGKGFYFKGDSANRAEKGRLSNCYSYRCQKGWDMEANGSTEYNTFSNCGAVDNFIGVKTGAGNIRWLGGVITDNARNVELVAGDNHLHGKMIGVAINHATSENLLATDIVYGFDFIGCDFYGDDANAGRITLNNSQGISISNGLLDCRVQVEAGLGTITGENKIINMTIAGVNASYQGDLSKLVSHGHIGLGAIDAKAFNRLQPIPLTLLGTWGGALNMTYDPCSNIVRLEGTVSSGAALTIANIPVGFRPKTTIQLPIDANGGYGAVSISSSTGDLVFEVGSGSAVRLDACSWQAWQ